MSLSGVTYYNDFVDINSINNPIVGSNVQMQFKGFFDKNWTRNGLNFDNVGYGLKKTVNNQGLIYCNDSSKLFSFSSGYVGILVNFPYSFVDGVYQLLLNDVSTLNEYILWGVNIGQYENSQPGFYAALTPRGIEFTIWTSRARHTLRDILLTENANTDIFFEFMWDSTQIDDYLIRAVLKVNGVYSAISNIPIEEDNIGGLSFCALNTPFSFSNLECTIKKLVISGQFPSEDFYSSSSSSISSSSLTSVSMSSYVPYWSTSSSSESSISYSFSSLGESTSSSNSNSSSSASTNSSSSTSTNSSSSVTVSYSSSSSTTSSSYSLPSGSSPSISSSSTPTSTSSDTTASTSSSSSADLHCNSCIPPLEENYTATIGGFTGSCAAFNGPWTMVHDDGNPDLCIWTCAILDIELHLIVLWWDSITPAWHVTFTSDAGGTPDCLLTTNGSALPCQPTGSYAGGEGTIVIS